MSAELDLGKLHLTLAKSELELHSTTTVLLSRPETQDDASGRLQLDLHTVKRNWIQRGSGLQLQVKVFIEGKAPTPALLQSLNSIICKSQVWPQLGLTASPVTLAQDSSERPCNETVTVALSHDANSREQPRDTVHSLCYTIPATDVAPPAGLKVLGLDVVRLELNIGRTINKKRRIQRKQMEAVRDDKCQRDEPNLHQSSMLFESVLPMATKEDTLLGEAPTDSGYDSLFSTQKSNGEGEAEMLLVGTSAIEDDEDDMLDVPSASLSSCFGSYSDMQTFTEDAPILVKSNMRKKRSASIHDVRDELEPLAISPGCITSLIDAVLRLSVEEKPWRLPQGLRVRSNNLLTRLSDISPVLWNPGYLQEISTRAPLLPTVAHALSHSIYTNVRSPTLKGKLQILLCYGIDDDADGDGEADEESSIHGPDEIVPKTRFGLMSALLWQVMQKRLHRPDTTRRLKNLTQGLDISSELEEDDEKLFARACTDGSKQSFDDDFMFDDDEEEGVTIDYEVFEEDIDEEFLFETTHCLGEGAEGDGEDLLLQDHIGMEHANGDESDLLQQDNTAAQGGEYENENLFGGCEAIVDLDEDDVLLQDLDG
ncbi:hypothetical protein E6O75_ATG07887 [Venturia nashicola]|uniref:Uncharacterized protein n=1 Tax=Venturia nashicola TaxID=86259 RepID=A0A4Z1NWU8_9PEZI|nr:hypothetical protein E6O75_ATG07887 [Venturia nashicola]